jgi:hypothetical protein
MMATTAKKFSTGLVGSNQNQSRLTLIHDPIVGTSSSLPRNLPLNLRQVFLVANILAPLGTLANVEVGWKQLLIDP